MLDIHNFYVVLSNSQKDRCKMKEGVKKCSRSCKQLIHIYQLNIYDITVWWSIKQIQLSEKEKSNPKKFDRMIQAIRSSKSVPGYSTILWEVKYNSKNIDSSKLWVMCIGSQKTTMEKGYINTVVFTA